MKNLKRTLCLVLAVIMVCGMFAISANAAFTDDAKIEYKDATAVLDAMGIIKGYPDGSFGPEATLTRAEGAYLIASLVKGPDEVAKLKGTASFTDVPADYWAAGAIAYCVGAGYINGNGDGTFDPEGQLTVVMFAALCAEALGYDGAREGFVSAEWKSKINMTASKAGLFADIPADIDAPCTRDIAAKFALNTLTADMVEYDTGSVTVEAGGATVIVGGSGAKKVKDDGDKKATINKDGVLQFAEDKYPKLTKATATNGVYGRPADGMWKYAGKEICTVATDTLAASYTKAVTTGTLYDLLGKSTVENANTDFSVYVDGKPVTGAKITDYAKKSGTGTVSGTGAGVLTEVYVDSVEKDIGGEKKDVPKVTIVIINTYFASAAADYDAKKEQLVANYYSTTETKKEVKLASSDFAVQNYKKNDYLLLTFDNGNVASVAPAESISGNVSSYTESKNVTVAGTKYSYNANTNAVFKGTSTDPYEIGSGCILVLDQYGNAIANDAVASTYTYAYIRKLAIPTDDFGENETVKAQAYFTDGTYKTITLKVSTKAGDPIKTIVDNAKAAHETTADVNAWYDYTESSGKYELKADLGTGVTVESATVAAIKGGEVKFAGTGNILATTKTQFIIVEANGAVKTYTGYKELKNYTKSGIVVSGIIKKGFATYVYIYVNANGTGVNTGTSEHIFMYAPSSDLVIEGSNKKYYANTALVNGERKTVNSTAKMSVGFYTEPEYNSNGYLTNATSITSTVPGDIYVVEMLKGATIKYAEGILVIGSNTYKVADNCTIKVYDRAGRSLDDWTGSKLADNSGKFGDVTVGSTTYKSAMYGIYKSTKDETLTTIYIYAATIAD